MIAFLKGGSNDVNHHCLSVSYSLNYRQSLFSVDSLKSILHQSINQLKSKTFILSFMPDLERIDAYWKWACFRGISHLNSIQDIAKLISEIDLSH